MATNAELVPQVLDSSSSSPPSIFDGTIRLYISLVCPYAQRVWIARNYKGLKEIVLVPLNIRDKPLWYKEKVYEAGRVPCLEHKGNVIPESIDLLYYLDNNFSGPKLLPRDLEKQDSAKELLQYAPTFVKSGYSGLKGDPHENFGPALDTLESALANYIDGPFIMGQEFSMVDIAFAPFIQRFEILFPVYQNYDIFSGRPLLASWFKKLNDMEAFVKTKATPEALIAYYKQHFLGEK